MLISVSGLHDCNREWDGNGVKRKGEALISGFQMNLFFLGFESCRARTVILLQLLIKWIHDFKYELTVHGAPGFQSHLSPLLCNNDSV